MSDKKLKTVNIKGKEYVEVSERIKAFREMPEFKGFSLETEIVDLTDVSVVLKAIIKDAEGRTLATGIAREKNGDSFINKTSYVENCETSAWGRALGNLGIGIEGSVASALEVTNAVKQQNKPLVQAPIQQQQPPPINISNNMATLAQAKRFYTMAGKFFKTDAEKKAFMKSNTGKSSSKDLTKADVNILFNVLEEKKESGQNQ